MSQVLDRTRNGVDTQTMYGTLDAIKADPSLGALPVPRPERVDRRRAQPLDDQGLLRRRAGGHLPRPGVHDRGRRAGRPARRRHGGQPRRGAAARPRGLPDHLARLRRGGAQGAPDRRRVDARGRDGRPRRARALRRGAQRLHRHQGAASRSRATPPTRSCARSSSARRPAPPSSTWSATACPSRWPSPRTDGGMAAGTTRVPAAAPRMGEPRCVSSPPQPRAARASCAWPRRSATSWRRAPPSTTATRRSRTPASTRSSASTTSPPRSPPRTAASTSPRCTTSSSRRAASLAATPPSPSA